MRIDKEQTGRERERLIPLAESIFWSHRNKEAGAQLTGSSYVLDEVCAGMVWVWGGRSSVIDKQLLLAEILQLPQESVGGLVFN